MELLYFIDSIFVKYAKLIASFFTRRYGWQLEYQWHVFVTPPAYCGVLIFFIRELYPLVIVEGFLGALDTFSILPFIGHVLLFCFMLLVLFCVSFGVVILLGISLISLHHFFDPNTMESSLDTNGYTAWSFLIVSGILSIAGYILYESIFDLPFFMLSWMMFCSAYRDFASRKTNNTSKRKEYMTEAFRALLERCTWLPQPMPHGQ